VSGEQQWDKKGWNIDSGAEQSHICNLSDTLIVLLGHKLTRDLSPYPERRGYVITRRNSVGGRHLLSDLDSGRT
jgi:hypothetical protein